MRELRPPTSNPPHSLRLRHATGSHSRKNSRNFVRRSPSQGRTRSTFTTSGGGALSPRAHSHIFGSATSLWPSTSSRSCAEPSRLSVSSSGSNEFAPRRSNCSPGPRSTTVAPARKRRSLSLPSRSTWNPCASCLMAATSRPSATNSAMAASSKVVLPLPECPQTATTGAPHSQLAGLFSAFDITPQSLRFIRAMQPSPRASAPSPSCGKLHAT